MPDPEYFRSVWLAHLADYLRITAERLASFAEEATEQGSLPSTRQRLEVVIDALKAQRATVGALLSSLAREPAAPLPSSLPHAEGVELAVLQYYGHVFRDWAWGEAENQAALALVRELAPERWGRLAIYGVGAGRLAVDIHRALEPESTLGLDLNPLPLLIASRLLLGATLELREFPLAPLSIEHVSVLHRLACPVSIRDGLELVFADALRPPVAPASLDAIVTPWFIDAVGADLRETAQAIHSALRPGGSWVNFGPLRFESSFSRSYLIDEVHDIVAQSGFEFQRTEQRQMPYFASPHSGEQRVDTVFAFRAQKTGAASREAARPRIPPWLTDTTLLIPVSRELEELRNMAAVTAGIASMIDGQRSIRDLSLALATQLNLAPAELENQLRTFLGRLPIR